MPPASDEEARTAQALIGKTLGGAYRIMRLASSGGFAWVFEAQHEHLEARVAVKVLRPSRPELEDYNASHFEAEARLGAGLRHPGLARIFDFRREAKAEYIVMEWLRGDNLARIADGRPMAWRRAADLVAQACDALAAVHAAGFLHRDVKPDNLIVEPGPGERERVVLIDLGLARQRPSFEPLVPTLAEPTLQPTFTPGYCAPEVFRAIGRGDPELPWSVASDVFAMGVTLYQLVAGRRPWRDQEAIAAAEPPPALASFGIHAPRALEEIVGRALAADPERRYPTIDAFGQALVELLRPAAAARPAPHAGEPAPTRRRRLGRGLLFGAALAGAGLSGAVVAGLRDEAARPSATVSPRPAPVPAVEAAARPALPSARDAFGAARGRLQACVARHGVGLSVEVRADANTPAFGAIVVTSEQADLDRCAREVLQSLRFSPPVEPVTLVDVLLP